MTTDRMWHGGATLESSPVAERAPWHADDCVIDIQDLEEYLKSSKTGESSPFCPEWKQGPSKSNSLCGAVGSLASMPFRYLSSTISRSSTTTKGKRCNSSDGCSTIAAEEAITSYTPFLPESSPDFLQSENSSHSHENSLNVESSLSALSIGQSQSLSHDAHPGHVQANQGTGTTKRFSWMGALKSAVTRSSQSPGDATGCAPSPFAASVDIWVSTLELPQHSTVAARTKSVRK